MAQGFVQLPDDTANTGKKEDHWQLATSSQYREGVVIGDSSVDAAVAKVQNAAQAASDYGLTVRPIVADGLDAAQGITTDAAVTGDNSGTVSAKLRGLSKMFADVWDSVNHWFKVSIQNATLAVTQSGTWTVQPGNTANTTAWKVDGSAVTQPVSGTVTANAGTNLNTSALALEGGGNLATVASAIKAEDAVHASGDKGVMALAVQTDGATILNAVGDYSPLTVDTFGALYITGSVSPIDAVGNPIGHAEDSASGDGQSGVPAMATRKATPANTSGTDGDYEFLQMSVGRLWTNTLLGDGTNAVAVKAASTAAVASDPSLVVALSPNSALPTGANTIGSITNVSTIVNTVSVTGTQATNAAGPGTTNLGVLPAIANAAAPTYVEGRLVLLSTDLTGAMRIVGTVTANPGLATSGGYTTSSFATAASNNSTSLKGSAGQLYGVHVYNNASYPIYIKFYNKATAPAPGTDNALLIRRIGVQAGVRCDITFPAGIPFTTGIGYAVVKGIGDTDNTSVVANDGLVDLEYT